MGFKVLRTMQPHAWDSVLSHLRNDKGRELRNDDTFCHSELDSESQELCCIADGIQGFTYYATTRLGFRIK